MKALPSGRVRFSATALEDPAENYSVYLQGRYFATLSMLPYVLLMLVLFFITSFLFALLFLQDGPTSFRITLMPFMLGTAVLSPVGLVILFMIRWHGRRRVDLTDGGMSLVTPNGSELFVPWQHLHAIELRFNKPKVVTCTLVTPIINFSFTNLELNLESRLPAAEIYQKGFDLATLRDFLYYLYRKAPQAQWRLGESFQDRFKIFYPPYDLEKMK